LSNSKDFSIGLGVVCFSLALLFYIISATVVTPRSVTQAVLSPDFWPNIIAWMMLFLGMVMMLKSLLTPRLLRSNTIGKKVDKKTLLRVLVLILFFVSFYQLLPELGMIWGSSLAYILLSVFICKTQYRATAVTVGLVLPVALYAFFYHVAGVDIPQNEFMRLP